MKISLNVRLITRVGGGCLALFIGLSGSTPATAGEWRPWLVQDHSQISVAGPPTDEVRSAEQAALDERAGSLDSPARHRVQYWNGGSVNNRWVQDVLVRHRKGPPSPFKSRTLWVLNVAIYDAVAIATNQKSRHQTGRPDSELNIVARPLTSGFPSARAAGNAAAAGVLAYLYPDEAAYFKARLEDAAEAQLDSGNYFPSDVEAGIALGKQVAEQVIEFAAKDNSDTEFDGERPAGPGFLQGEVFVYPTAGEWKTSVIDNVDDFLPPPPPGFDSAEMAKELETLKSMDRSIPSQISAWTNHGVASAYENWYKQVALAVFENGLSDDLVRTAHIYASISAANHDSILACFNAKYEYWLVRPAQLDESLQALFPNPPHPSYPAAHSCSSWSYATSLSHFFPEYADEVKQVAENAGISRLIAGIHYPSDHEAGTNLGVAVTREVLDFSQSLIQ